MPDRPGITIFKDRMFQWKPVQNTIFIKRKLVTDVVTSKYIEEAQPLKLQPA